MRYNIKFVSKSVSMGLTVSRQAAKNLTVNRQKAVVISRQMALRSFNSLYFCRSFRTAGAGSQRFFLTPTLSSLTVLPNILNVRYFTLICF